MPRYLIKLTRGEESRYLEWSTVVDAPVSYGMTLDELWEHVRRTDGERGVNALAERLLRVEKTGTSAFDQTLDEVISLNRAGKGEKRLSKERLWDEYCAPSPERPKTETGR